MKNSNKKSRVILAFLCIFFTNLFIIPEALAQLEIKNYSATYELAENGMNVTEVILFSNPEKSSMHTYDKDLILKRAGAEYESIFVSGISYSKTENGFIYLKFSKDWLIKGKEREVKINYFIPVSGKLEKGEKVKIYTFRGKLLPELPMVPENAVVSFITPENFEFSFVSFPGERKIANNREVLIYTLTSELIKANPVIEFEYGNFKETGENLASLAEENIAKAKENIESVERKLSLSAKYNLTFSEIEEKLNKSRENLKLAEKELADYGFFNSEKKFYDAYKHAEKAHNFSISARNLAEEAEIDFSLNLEAALRERILEIGNISKKKEKEENISQVLPGEEKKIENVSGNLTGLRSAANATEISGKKETEGKINSKVLIILIFSLLLLSAFFVLNFLLKREKEEKERKEDLSAISIIKRQKFDDFEKKLESVRSDAEIADEIIKLRKQKDELREELNELERKLKKYEITEEKFASEKSRIEKKIKELEIRIADLEEEIKSK